MRQMTLEQAAQVAMEHLSANRLPQAEAMCRQILGIQPEQFEALHTLGVIAFRVGRADAAMELFQRAIQVNSSRPDAWNHLGIVMVQTGRHDEAIAAWKKVIELQPNYAPAHNNLGNLFGLQGRIEEAIEAHRNAVRLEPIDPWKHSNLLRDLNFSSTITPAQLLEEHKRWWWRHGAPPARSIAQHANDRNPDRRLRVGFLSPDFRRHSVAYFLEPIYANRDRSAFEFFSYAQVAVGDEVTEWFRSQSDGWRPTVRQGEDAVASMIRADRIDVLVELAGHTADSRVLVCARKPAPVQVSYLGYPFSTGLATIDYRLTDAVADPPGDSEQFYTENLVRLGATAWCYRPPDDAPAVAPPPVGRNGFVTFGSFNSFGKVSPGVVEAWARILGSVVGSKLMLKGSAMGDAGLRQRAVELFGRQGVGEDRLIFCQYEPPAASHLARYGQVDIALDTFPYAGTTTTCEALWMGVAVVTLAGAIHLTRVGASLLRSVGLNELVANNIDAYVATACSLATDAVRMHEIRSRLRERMERSPLRDEVGFSRAFEGVLRDMWRNWCVSGSG